MNTKGYAVHIGVATPAPLGTTTFGDLPGAIEDANELARITATAGFSNIVLTGANATQARVLDELKRACLAAGTDGTVVVTFSGHGWQIQTNDPEEGDHFDEIWMLSDGYLVDTTVGRILHSCEPGVIVVAILDACRSRTGAFIQPPSVVDVPLGEILQTLDAPDLVDRETGATRPAATVLTLAAVDNDDASAYENDRGGVFTSALLDSWENLRLAGTRPSWAQLWSRTVGHVHAYQRLEGPQWPVATLRGADIAMLDRPAFTP
jgi:hypothetical protein